MDFWIARLRYLKVGPEPGDKGEVTRGLDTVLEGAMVPRLKYRMFC